MNFFRKVVSFAIFFFDWTFKDLRRALQLNFYVFQKKKKERKGEKNRFSLIALEGFSLFFSFLFFLAKFNRTIFNLIPPRLSLNDRFSPCSTSNWLRKYKKISNISSDRSSSREGNDRLRDSNFPFVKLYLFHGRYSFTTYFPCLRYYVFLPFLSLLAERWRKNVHERNTNLFIPCLFFVRKKRGKTRKKHT